MVDQFIRDTQHDRYPVAVHLILTDPTTGRVLLMRRDGTDYGRHQLAFVAGHVDMGEKVTDCVVRETAEEIGIELGPADLVPAGVMFRRSAEPRVDFFFSANVWKGEPRICEPHKCSELVWADPGSLPVDVLDFVPRALDNVRNGRHFDEFGWKIASALPG